MPRPEVDRVTAQQARAAAAPAELASGPGSDLWRAGETAPSRRLSLPASAYPERFESGATFCDSPHMTPAKPTSAGTAAAVHLLTACALADFALALVHVACIFAGESTARFFTAPRYVLELIRSGSPLIFPVCLVIVAVLGTFGLYAWSAAGRMQALPWLRGGLVTVGVIFTLRGLLLLPQVAAMLRHPGIFPWQVPVFSLVALGLGLAHLAGARRRWGAPAPLDNRAVLHN